MNARAASQNAQIANANASATANAQVARGNGRNRSVVNGQTAVNNTAAVNGAVANRALAARAASAPIVNNWQNVSGQNYGAFRDYHRSWHDRSWWDNHYSNIILVGGGYWYWDGGYWYPAWGYDQSYTYYPYDGPIYGYSSLTPDQIIVNVQTQLANDGYYVGAIDGVLGPQTRRAIAAFQADNGLAVTSAVDEPTLSTLGLS